MMKSIEAAADEAVRKTSFGQAMEAVQKMANRAALDMQRLTEALCTHDRAVPIRTKGPTMNKRDEAAEAAIQAFTQPRMHTNESRGKLRADLAAALDAALAVLQPTVPNEVEALEALPVGTVIRAVDEEGGVWVHWRLGMGSWHNGREGDADSDLARLSGDWGITEWQVIYWPEGDE